MTLFRSKSRPHSAVLFHVWTGERYLSAGSAAPPRDISPLIGLLRDLNLAAVPHNFHVHVTDEESRHLHTISADEIPAHLWERRLEA